MDLVVGFADEVVMAGRRRWGRFSVLVWCILFLFGSPGDNASMNRILLALESKH